MLHHTYASPWALDVPASADLARLTSAEPDARVVAFHWAERGEFLLSAGDDRVVVGAGELAVCFGGLRHRMERGDGAWSRSLADVLSGRVQMPPGEAQPGATRLVCGVFVLRDPTLNPLLGALPSVLHARVLDGLEPVARVLRAELESPGNGSAFIVDRTLEVLCATVIRQYLTTRSEEVGLLRTLEDPRLCRALENVHREPGAPWTVEALARCAGLSRSRFSARFVALAGEGPMAYVTRWRMNVALRLLRSHPLSVAEVASRVGYESVPAFSRVFKRHVGTSPARSRSARGRDHPAAEAAG